MKFIEQFFTFHISWNVIKDVHIYGMFMVGGDITMVTWYLWLIYLDSRLQ